MPAPLLFLAFMGLQGRYFGRWLLPIFPILCLLAAFFALQLARRGARAGAGASTRRASRVRRARALAAGACARALLVARAARPGSRSTASTPACVLSRADTRNLTRDWMLAHIPRGRADRRRAGRARTTGARALAHKYPSLVQYARISRLDAAARSNRVRRRRSASRTTSARSRPALIGYYEQHGYCWVVSGSTESGRALADPRAVPQAIAYYRALARTRRSRLPRLARTRAGQGPVAFDFDWSFDYYPLAYHRPGPVMTVYRLHGGRCALTRAQRRSSAGTRVILDAQMTSCTDTDKLHLARAIELARNGVGAVKPNPVVGAVVARDGEVLGEGWHERIGAAHAEVNAIEACGLADLSDATLYVSLEPCCHEGKTPPCTDAILQAGIRRVVVASDDPTEKASGRGLGILRDEGVEVVLADGELATSARLLNQAFRKHARVGRPWVLFKSAMTLDGKVATRTGDSKWISGEASRELAHQWRASVDAVVVGIGTALADDPQLTARPDGLAGRARASQPRRVVFDSLARLPPSSQLVTAAPRYR